MALQDITLLTTSRTPQLNGIAFPVIEGTGGFFTKTDGAETVMSGLKQLILTNKGERVMRPDFGTSVRRMVFEPYTEGLRVNLENEIRHVIRKYAPGISILDLSIKFEHQDQYYGKNSAYIYLRFDIKDDITEPQILEIIV